MKKTVLCAYILLHMASVIPDGLFARDINLDSIYINAESRLYDRLLEKKLEAYQAAGSQFVDRDVIFASWGDGHTILYVKELPRLNIVYSFNRSTRRPLELFRISGTITGMRCSENGRYIFIKRLLGNPKSLPRGETLVLDISGRTVKTLESSYPFLDFSIAPGGASILFESKDGIVEYYPESGRRSLVIRKSNYIDIVSPGAPSIAYLSPNRKQAILVCGSGGAYKAKMIADGRTSPVPGVTSASEFHWVDNRLAVYRRGYAGNYSVVLYDTAARHAAELCHSTLNANIQFSIYPKMITFLEDQVIHVYDSRRAENIRIGLEGEDIAFSPDGNRFISLYLKKLFITSMTTVKKKNVELAKTAREIRELYRNLLNSASDMANEYSPDYIRKKISVYGKLSE